MRAWLMTALASMALGSAQAQSPPLQLYAAGSLREAMTAVAQQFEAQTGRKVALTFGASGLLRERIEKGEPAQVFASADMDHPQRLAAQGGWQAPAVFALNQMCALAAPSVEVSPDTLLDAMLRPTVRVGTSTPQADPSGDYAWALFRRAESLRAGAQAALEAKALQLTGGAGSPKPPAGRGTYAWVMDQGQADVFLTYCTNAVAAQREVPRLKIVAVPEALQVSARYGLTSRSDVDAGAAQLALFILSPTAQAILRSHGFGQP
jgi:molybdate transport system substrate-binding protein